MDANERSYSRLVRVVLDGIATDAEVDELRRLTAAQPELVTSVLDELTIDALLRWQSGGLGEELPLAQEGSRNGPLPVRATPRPTASLAVAAATLAIAASLALVLIFGGSGDNSVIADVVNPKGVSWSKDSTALVNGAVVRRGRLASNGGEYTLQFRDGSMVRVVGPATLDIKSKMLVNLEHGNVTADVPENSIGFTITTAFAEVIDQGTQFGISAESGHTNVVVFDGKVDVRPRKNQTQGQQRLVQGDAIKIDGAGEFGRLVDIRRDAEGRWWSGDEPSPGSHLIARVTDNIWGGPEKYVCYQTTYSGLQDDALAYSDNPNHQWNGLNAEGIPGFLRGADYIRTFNHFRYMEYFEMTVQLSAPCNLYVFSDNRLPPPDWLVEDFEDTGVDIGLDEGPWLEPLAPKYRKLDVNTVADGPGKSIDNVFSVWRRQCDADEPIVLGYAGSLGSEGGQGRAMYGVAATPLNAPKDAIHPPRASR